MKFFFSASFILGLCLSAEPFEFEQDRFGNLIHQFDSGTNIQRQREIINDLLGDRRDYLTEHPEAQIGILLRGMSPKLIGEVFDFQKPEYMGEANGEKQYFLRYDSVAPELHFSEKTPFIAAGHIIFMIDDEVRDPGKYVLLIKDKNKNNWWLPGGTMNRGEFSPADTALRELLEETTFGGKTGVELTEKDIKLTGIVEKTTHLFGAKDIQDIDHIFAHHVPRSKISSAYSTYEMLHRLMQLNPSAQHHVMEIKNNVEISHVALLKLPPTFGDLQEKAKAQIPDRLEGFSIPDALKMLIFQGVSPQNLSEYRSNSETSLLGFGSITQLWRNGASIHESNRRFKRAQEKMIPRTNAELGAQVFNGLILSIGGFAILVEESYASLSRVAFGTPIFLQGMQQFLDGILALPPLWEAE